MRYFKNDDWLCSCGCGFDVTDEVKDICDQARHIAGIPFIITSGARCLQHNRSIKSSDTSSHIKGLAVDIKTHGSHSRFLIIEALMRLGVSRFGINFDKNFIHFDISKDKPQELIFGY